MNYNALFLGSFFNSDIFDDTSETVCDSRNRVNRSPKPRTHRIAILSPIS